MILKKNGTLSKRICSAIIALHASLCFCQMTFIKMKHIAFHQDKDVGIFIFLDDYILTQWP